jgi:hypothetical protein
MCMTPPGRLGTPTVGSKSRSAVPGETACARVSAAIGGCGDSAGRFAEIGFVVFK